MYSAVFLPGGPGTECRGHRGGSVLAWSRAWGGIPGWQLRLTAPVTWTDSCPLRASVTPSGAVTLLHTPGLPRMEGQRHGPEPLEKAGHLTPVTPASLGVRDSCCTGFTGSTTRHGLGQQEDLGVPAGQGCPLPWGQPHRTRGHPLWESGVPGVSQPWGRAACPSFVGGRPLEPSFGATFVRREAPHSAGVGLQHLIC